MLINFILLGLKGLTLISLEVDPMREFQGAQGKAGRNVRRTRER